ncbi:hypothetical protein JCM17960_07640 [Magnetospira thiophila]
MTDYLIAILGIGGLLSGWIFVQQVSRNYALKHPEFGPPKEEGGGCGGPCSCSSASHCAKADQNS